MPSFYLKPNINYFIGLQLGEAKMQTECRWSETGPLMVANSIGKHMIGQYDPRRAPVTTIACPRPKNPHITLQQALVYKRRHQQVARAYFPGFLLSPPWVASTEQRVIRPPHFHCVFLRVRGVKPVSWDTISSVPQQKIKKIRPFSLILAVGACRKWERS